MAVLKKKKIGVVIGNKMDKTATVEVARKIKHPHFKKYFVRTKKFKVHDEKNECQIGDQVEIIEGRPVSREKHWVVTKIISKAGVIAGAEIAV
ncbi:MAG: 30S ribosomal subunit protein S17 [uncultured bacterium]|nr:MAG: 30S ribosomal subunit protein S17 [uncultured bacterium]